MGLASNMRRREFQRSRRRCFLGALVFVLAAGATTARAEDDSSDTSSDSPFGGRGGLLQRLRQQRPDSASTAPAGPVDARAATACGRGLNVGFTITTFSNVKTAIWYPTTAAESRFQYANNSVSAVAKDAPVAACGAYPFVVFSHGFGGCGIQSVFLTEELARHGYIVAAPDHQDARCHVDAPASHGGGFGRPKESFRSPEDWTESTYTDRRDDIRSVVDGLLQDVEFGPHIDAHRMGIVGHSLGGYTAMGMAGGWDTWSDPRFKAALLLSPYARPYIVSHRVGAIHIPVMYQGGTRDFGITPYVKQEGGAYDQSHAPKYFVDLESVGHFGWTNMACRGVTVPECLKTKETAQTIDRYAIGFLDKYVKGTDTSVLSGSGEGLAEYRHDGN